MWATTSRTLPSHDVSAFHCSGRRVVTGLSAPRRILPSVKVDDVDGLLDRVEAAGGRVLGPSTDMPWGERVAHVHDPDGNMVDLTRPLQESVG
ncbi:VOC family protein [Streptosporangium sp. V21-05]|uniref:VOC family protein n=1 Tax=Streptosporangium sp. V21-05 TaxID=3446115 RepID=UPI003F5297B2